MDSLFYAYRSLRDREWQQEHCFLPRKAPTIEKYIDDIWPGAVYMSLLDNVLKVVRTSTEREGNVLDIPSVDSNQTAGKKIESYSEILNSVSYTGRKIVRNLVLDTNNEKVIKGLTILFDHDSIRIFCNEVSDLTLKLTYVFFGG